MKERMRNVWVGVTALVALCGLGVMLVLFGNLAVKFQKGYRIHTVFLNAGGLNSGSRVKLSGIDVGEVVGLYLLPPPDRGVEVTILVKGDLPLAVGTSAMIDAPLLGGTPAIGLVAPQFGPNDKPKLLPTDGTAKIPGLSDNMASQLAAQVKDALQEPLSKFDRLSVQLDKLTGEWTRVGQNISSLTSPRSVDDVDAGKEPGNLATIVVRTDQRLKELKEVLGGINSWVNDAELRASLKKTAENANKITAKVDAGIDKFTQLADSSRESIDKLAKRYVAVADDLSGTITELNKTLEAARKGEGTVGKLINDPALYNNLNDAVQRMNEAMVEVKLLVEKWKKEGLPVQF